VVDVFEQVEEELRSARYKRLAKTWLPVVGGVLAIALIAALAWWGWDSWQTSRAEKASVAYSRGVEAMQTNNASGAEAAFAEAENVGNGAYKSLALMQRAGLAVTADKTTEAVALFDEAAKVTSDPLLADSAAYRAALLVMDTAPLADVQARLEPLIEEGRPLRPFAQQALAMAQLQHGKLAEARAGFVQLTLGQNVPDVIRQFSQGGIDAIDGGVAANLPQIIAAQKALPAPAPAQGLADGLTPSAPQAAPAQ